MINNHVFKKSSIIAIDSPPKSPRDNKSLQFRAWKVNSKVLERSAKYQHQLDELCISAFDNSHQEIERKKMTLSTISTKKTSLRRTSACFLSPPRNRETLSGMNDRRPFVGYYDPPNLSSIKPRNLICSIRSPVAFSPLRAQNDIQKKNIFKFSPNNSSIDLSMHNDSLSDDRGKNIKLIKGPDFAKQLARCMLNI